MVEAKKPYPMLTIIFHQDGDDIEFENTTGLTVARLQRAMKNAHNELRKVNMRLIQEANRKERQVSLDESLASEIEETEVTEDE